MVVAHPGRTAPVLAAGQFVIAKDHVEIDVRRLAYGLEKMLLQRTWRYRQPCHLVASRPRGVRALYGERLCLSVDRQARLRASAYNRHSGAVQIRWQVHSASSASHLRSE